MAVATTQLLQLRPIYHLPSATTSIRSFASFSNSPDHPNQNSPQTNASTSPPPPQSSFSSYFSDVKSRLKQQQPHQSGIPKSQSKIRDLEAIRKNLSEFRLRSAAPTTSSQSPQHLSFQDIYQRNVPSSGEQSSPSSSLTPGGGGGGLKSIGKQSLDSIRASLKQLRQTTPQQNQNQGPPGRINAVMSLAKFKETLKLKPGEHRGEIRGMDSLPMSIFGKEIREKDGGSNNNGTMKEFVRIYKPAELGERLRSLRPEKKGKNWFSLEELNERLTKLREIEEKEDQIIPGMGLIYKDLKQSLVVLDNVDKEKKKPMQSIGILTHLGATPNFMLHPPKENLVEQYFHPDNMSASEKLKLELKKVRDEFKLSESDSGSARVQVAQLTTKIKHLSAVLHKKDKHSKKGLLGMVQKRKKLLKYLRRTDWESYSFVLSKLGLRDNPDYKS